MENVLQFFDTEMNEMFMRACNSIQQQVRSLPSYQEVSARSEEAAARLKQALPKEQQYLADEWAEAEAAVNAEFIEALFIRGMQYGARLAALLHLPNDRVNANVEGA